MLDDRRGRHSVPDGVQRKWMLSASVVQHHIGRCLKAARNAKSAEPLWEMNPREPCVVPGAKKGPAAHRSRIVPANQFDCLTFDIRRRRLGVDGWLSHNSIIYVSAYFFQSYTEDGASTHRATQGADTSPGLFKVYPQQLGTVQEGCESACLTD